MERIGKSINGIMKMVSVYWLLARPATHYLAEKEHRKPIIEIRPEWTKKKENRKRSPLSPPHPPRKIGEKSFMFLCVPSFIAYQQYA